MTWQELVKLINGMSEEDRKKQVKVSHEVGVILYPVFFLKNTSDHEWEGEVQKGQPFLSDQ